MKNCIILIAIMGISIIAVGQQRFRFDLSGIYGGAKNNSKALGSVIGIGWGEFYQPLKNLPVLIGISGEILKCEKLHALNFPFYLSVAYPGYRQAIAPIASVSIGHNIFDFVDDDPSKAAISTQKGSLYASFNAGVSFNKWNSAPYLVIGMCSLGFNNSIFTRITQITNLEKFHKTEFFLKFGFSFK